jgi:hypothetical protein
VHGTGNVIQGNASIGNAGNGIWVGGCPAGPQFAPTVGFTNTQILNNVAVRNNVRGCGMGLPAPPGCGPRPNTPNFDLLDTSGVLTCPSTAASIQSICTGLGFGSPPGGSTPFLGTRVIVPGNQACDNNVWFGNVYGTAFPPCTTNGGRQVGAANPAPTVREFLAAGTAAEDPPATGTPSVSRRAAAMAERGHRAP